MIDYASVIKKNYYKLLFLLPALVLIGIFFITPNALNFFYAFTDWNTFKSEITFNGLKNFIDLTKEGVIWKSLLITIQYAVLVCIIQNGLALILALAIEKTSRNNGILRTIFFLPVLISSLASGYLFKAILDPKGPVNKFFSLITGNEIAFPFLGSIKFTLFFVILVHAWKFFGIPVLVYIAALNYIPVELIEAARVEGASNFGTIMKIKLPLIGPAFTFSVTTALIGSLSTFEIPFSLTRGGPARATEVLNGYLFTLFGSGRWGYATSISLMLFLVILIFAFPVILTLKKREVEL